MNWVTFEVVGGGLVAVQLQHIVAIYDVGTIRGQPYLMMQLVEGNNQYGRTLLKHFD